eukprot:Selendium_serpulae@DN5369_c0_g1_i1.p1
MRDGVVSFYTPRAKRSLLFKQGALEMPTSGWERSVIYGDQHYEDLDSLGYCGGMWFIKLSDGRIIATNDLWDESWSPSVPTGALVGVRLNTKMCRPKSNKTMGVILDLLSECHAGGRLTLKSGLTDKEAFDLTDEISGELPEKTPRQYKGPRVFASFSSPEGATLTHLKLGEQPIQPLLSTEQLKTIDPTKTSVYLLYGEGLNCLQKGDTIDECYVRLLPGWSDSAMK